MSKHEIVLFSNGAPSATLAIHTKSQQLVMYLRPRYNISSFVVRAQTRYSLQLSNVQLMIYTLNRVPDPHQCHSTKALAAYHVRPLVPYHYTRVLDWSSTNLNTMITSVCLVSIKARIIHILITPDLYILKTGRSS